MNAKARDTQKGTKRSAAAKPHAPSHPKTQKPTVKTDDSLPGSDEVASETAADRSGGQNHAVDSNPQ